MENFSETKTAGIGIGSVVETLHGNVSCAMFEIGGIGTGNISIGNKDVAMQRLYILIRVFHSLIQNSSFTE